MAPRYRSPSRLKYAARKPTVGVHLDLDTHVKAMELCKLTGKSFAQLFREALDLVSSDYETVHALALEKGEKIGFERGWQAGILQGRLECGIIATSCTVCSEPIIGRITPTVEPTEHLAQYRGAWYHVDCFTVALSKFVRVVDATGSQHPRASR
jgi:hypothetical protein